MKSPAKPIAAKPAPRSLGTRRAMTSNARLSTPIADHPTAGSSVADSGALESARLGLERQWLHAVRLGFRHPGTGEPVAFESGYPQDLQHALDVLRGD